ncbi:very short patch repair endonuclease [Sinomonas atrocyanea]|uniref:very short patch repair endonuclease n=1 Tax=Sinomonas atrocyanea TaxID=37927 RepID=UPI003D969B47
MTSPATRKAMQANKRRDTAAELALRSALHRQGLRFRKDLRLTSIASRPRPDIVFTRARVAVFVDGCFWHACPVHGRPPKSNTGYWEPKLRGNVNRDRLNDAALHDAGWAVVRIWEHEQTDEAVDAVLRALGRARLTATVDDHPPLA